MKRVIHLAIGIVLVAATATAAGAAPGGKTSPTGGGGGKVSADLVIPDTVLGATTRVQIVNGTSQAWVEISCYQGTSRVTYSWFEVRDGSGTFVINDSVQYELGRGGADCQARADSWNVRRQRYELLDTTTFHVSDS